MESLQEIEDSIEKSDISNSLKKKMHKLIRKIKTTGKFKDIKDYINSSEFALIKNQINSNISSYCANGKHEKCPGHFLSNKNIKCECECHKK